MAKAKYFISQAFSDVDIAALYDKSSQFRKYANQAAVVLAGFPKSTATTGANPEGRAMAVAAAQASQKVGVMMGWKAKFPHPTLILSWLIALGENVDSIRSGWAKEGNEASLKELPEPAILMSLVESFKFPVSGQFKAEGQRKWLATLQAANVSQMPYWFVDSVKPHKPESTAGNKMVQGHRLLSITLAVPYGGRAMSPKPANLGPARPFGRQGKDAPHNVVVPTGVRYVELNLQSDLVKQLFGQVWICSTKDRKGIFLATERSHALKFREFLNLLSSGTTGSSNGRRYATDLPMAKADLRKFPTQPPTALQEKVRDAESKKDARMNLLNADAFVPTDSL